MAYRSKLICAYITATCTYKTLVCSLTHSYTYMHYAHAHVPTVQENGQKHLHTCTASRHYHLYMKVADSCGYWRLTNCSFEWALCVLFVQRISKRNWNHHSSSTIKMVLNDILLTDTVLQLLEVVIHHGVIKPLGEWKAVAFATRTLGRLGYFTSTQG